MDSNTLVSFSCVVILFPLVSVVQYNHHIDLANVYNNYFMFFFLAGFFVAFVVMLLRIIIRHCLQLWRNPCIACSLSDFTDRLLFSIAYTAWEAGQPGAYTAWEAGQPGARKDKSPIN